MSSASSTSWWIVIIGRTTISGCRDRDLGVLVDLVPGFLVNELFMSNDRSLRSVSFLLWINIYTLQQWARRSMATADKIRYIISFLKYRMAKDDDMQYSALLIEDYKQIALSIDAYSRRLEALVSINTSLI